MSAAAAIIRTNIGRSFTIAQAGGVNLDSLDFRLFSLSSNAFDHLASAPFRYWHKSFRVPMAMWLLLKSHGVKWVVAYLKSFVKPLSQSKRVGIAPHPAVTGSILISDRWQILSPERTFSEKLPF